MGAFFCVFKVYVIIISMNWLVYTAASVLSDSSRIYIDNYISDYYYKGKGAASQKYFYAVAFIVLAVVLLIISVATSSLSLSLSRARLSARWRYSSFPV